MCKRILVIDDNLAIRKSFVLALEDAGYQIDTAQSGKAGIDKVSNTEYDLIFLDLRMPEINGVETLIKLRDDGHKMPVYIITAFYGEFMDQLKIAVDEGYEFEVIRKPIDTEDLVHITKAVLEGVRAMIMYELELYVVSRTPKSVEVVEELVKFLEDALDSYYHLEVIDVIESPELAEKAKILVTPTLIKVAPEPQTRVVGDLSDKKMILLALGLTSTVFEEQAIMHRNIL